MSREALDLRQAIMGAELQATGTDISEQMGGARDAVLQQQLSAISDQFANLTSAATDSIVDGLYQAMQADGFGIGVTDAEIDAEVETRQTTPARVQVSIIAVNALPEDAASGAEPTEDDFARAEEEAADIAAELDAGGDFATIATEQSDDAASAQFEGLVGWVQEDDVQYGYLYPLADGVETGELSGPSRTDEGYVILRVEDRTEAGPFTELVDQLDAARVTDADYRAFVADELLRRAFRTHFEEEVAVSPAPQREIAQILVLERRGSSGPQAAAPPSPGPAGAGRRSGSPGGRYRRAMGRGAGASRGVVHRGAGPRTPTGSSSARRAMTPARATTAATSAGTTRPPASSCPSSRPRWRGWRWATSANRSGPSSATTSSRSRTSARPRSTSPRA